MGSFKGRNALGWLRLMVAAVVVCMVASACSSKKNTAATRNYQAFITRYNVYFNGDEHYKETLKTMETKYEDDYSQRLFLHPVEATTHPKSPQPTGNFDRSIEKAQKAIQLHSVKQKPKKKSGKSQDEAYKAWMKRSEYNPFLHNAWMMMGRSQYFNGDFSGAASTFMYIARNFTWLPNTVTEARLREALAYCGMDWLFEAETMLNRIKPEQLNTKQLRGLYAYVSADLAVRQKNWEKAAPLLHEAISSASGAQKTRLWFLLGQVYAEMGRKNEAYEAFKKAGSGLNATYRTKLNARIKQSEVYTGANIEPEVKALRRMTHYDRNKDYLDQIYYAIGNLYLSRGDTLHAIENYKLAAEKSTRQGIDRAMSQLTLGGLYFDRREYDLAQPCYAEAVPLLPDDFNDYKAIKRRSDVLDELTVYSGNVTLQDSLLRLADMSEDERLAVIDKIIADLKKKEKEEADAAKREAYLAEAEAAGNNLGAASGSNAPSTFTMNTDNSWYFYNTQAVSAGKADFQRRWGSRKLEDNWRRRNKTVFNTSDFSAEADGEEEDNDGELPDTDETDEEKEQRERANDPHYPEYYLAQIPLTPQARTSSEEIVQEGLYNMGVILKNQLYDFDAAAAEFNTLNRRFPDNIYRLDAYYNMYLMYMQAGRTGEAERVRQTILAEFPESPQGVALQNPDYIESLRRMLAVEGEMYNRALNDYLNNRNRSVHEAYETMQTDYPMSQLMPRFMFLDALAYVTDNRPDEFNRTLMEMLDRYPDTDMSPLASSWLKGMAAGRKLSSDGGNRRGMVWDTRLVMLGDSTSTAGGEGGPIEFSPDRTGPYVLMLAYDLQDPQVVPNALLYNVARHNFMSFTVRDFDLDQMSFPPVGMLLVKGFDGEREAIEYRRQLQDDSSVDLAGVRPVLISAANLDALLKGGGTLDEYFEFMGETVADEVHEAVLPADESFATRQEMYEEPQQELSADMPEEEEILDEMLEDYDPRVSTGDPDIDNIDEALLEDTDTTVRADTELPAQPGPVKVIEPVEEEEPELVIELIEEPEPVKPIVPVKPTEPSLPVGSEGDDPLLDE